MSIPRLNEAELLSPIEDMVAAIERRLEHEAGQCGPDCRQCCLDCERVSIFAVGIEKPIQTVVTDPCPRHR